jgi:hypothetical protein
MAPKHQKTCSAKQTGQRRIVSQSCRIIVEQNRLVKKALPYVVQTKKPNVEQNR